MSFALSFLLGKNSCIIWLTQMFLVKISENTKIFFGNSSDYTIFLLSCTARFQLTIVYIEWQGGNNAVSWGNKQAIKQGIKRHKYMANKVDFLYSSDFLAINAPELSWPISSCSVCNWYRVTILSSGTIRLWLALIITYQTSHTNYCYCKFQSYNQNVIHIDNIFMLQR